MTKEGPKVARVTYQLKPNNYVQISVVDLPKKVIVCFPCQVGCGWYACRFCSARKYKYDLDTTTMYDLCRKGLSVFSPAREQYTIFSCMGEGDPFTSDTLIQSVVSTFRALRENKHLLLPAEPKFAMSTVGVGNWTTEGLKYLCSQVPVPFTLQISLHTVDVFLRDTLGLPRLEKLDRLKKAVTRGLPFKVEWNVCPMGMIDRPGTRNTVTGANAERLGWYLPQNSNVKINRYNPTTKHGILSRVIPEEDEEIVTRFVKILSDYGHKVERYSTDGQDIQAGCGQGYGDLDNLVALGKV